MPPLQPPLLGPLKERRQFFYEIFKNNTGAYYISIFRKIENTDKVTTDMKQ
jgi:ribosomal protein S6